MTAQLAFDHVADFIATMNPAKVLELRAPETIRLRFEELIKQEKDVQLTATEKDELDTYYGFQADHIISWRHGGATNFENLAYACPDCNRNKGTDLGTFSDHPDLIVRFFNPRKDVRSEHFEVQTQIMPIFVKNFNHVLRFRST